MPSAVYLYKGPVEGEPPYTYWQLEDPLTLPDQQAEYDAYIADGWFENLPQPPEIPVEPRTLMIKNI